MAFRVLIDDSELRNADKRLAKITDKDFRDLLTAVGETMMQVADSRFQSKTDPDGRSWAPWSESYRKSGRGRSLLERSGKMRKSLRKRVTRRTVRVKFGVDYYEFHHDGTSRMPKRQILGFGGEDLTSIDQTVEDWFRSKGF